MIIRKIDDVGRFVLPKEIRNSLNIKEGDNIEISQEGNCIILNKPDECCVFCGTNVHTTEFSGQYICRDCVQGIIEKGLRDDS